LDGEGGSLDHHDVRIFYYDLVREGEVIEPAVLAESEGHF
jgi:hypothetical protein